jgi:hypothetical protein
MDSDPARLVSDSGTKAAPLLGPGNRGCVRLSVSYRNVSAALSLLNKVYNSIYTTNQQLTLYVHDYTHENGSPRKEQFGYWSLSTQV